MHNLKSPILVIFFSSLLLLQVVPLHTFEPAHAHWDATTSKAVPYEIKGIPKEN